MPQTRSQTKFKDIKEKSQRKDCPIADQPSTRSFRMVVPNLIDRTDDRTLFEIVREYTFVPANAFAAMVIHSDVHRVVNDIIRDGDFRILTWKMIYQQVSLTVSRQSMLQYESNMHRYIQDSLAMTIWTGIPKALYKSTWRHSDGEVDEDKTEPEAHKRKKDSEKNVKKKRKKKRKKNEKNVKKIKHKRKTSDKNEKKKKKRKGSRS